MLYGNFQIGNRMPLFLKIHTTVLRAMGHRVGNLFSKGLKKGKKTTCMCVEGFGVRKKCKKGRKGQRE